MDLQQKHIVWCCLQFTVKFSAISFQNIREEEAHIVTIATFSMYHTSLIWGAISSAKIFNFRIEKGETLNSSKHLAIKVLLEPLTMKYVKVWFLFKELKQMIRATTI